MPSKPPRPHLDDVIALVDRRHWPAIPVQPNNKSSFVKWTGFQGRCPSIEELTSWDRQFNPELWAVITGKFSGIVVADFDGESGRELMERWGITKPHTKTGSGGFHLYLKHPGWRV